MTEERPIPEPTPEEVAELVPSEAFEPSELDLAFYDIAEGAIEVKLIDAYGHDLRIMRAARGSYGRETAWDLYCPSGHVAGLAYDRPSWEPYPQETCQTCQGEPRVLARTLGDRDLGVMNWMMRERHGSPFEMVDFTFWVRVPIAAQRDWVRHRIASFNEISTRYVKLGADFYLPRGDDLVTRVGRPGDYEKVPITDPEVRLAVQTEMAEVYERAWAGYQKVLDLTKDPEVASYLVPMGQYTQFFWKTNLRSLFNFVALRNHKTARRTIHRPADAIEAIAFAQVPVAMGLFNKHGRRAP